MYNLVVERLDAKKNAVSVPSGSPHYEIGHENPTARLLATSAATTITESYGDLLPEFKAAQETDIVAIEIQTTLADVSITDESQWRLVDTVLTYEWRISMLMALCSRVTNLFNNKPTSSHFGALTTDELVSPDS